MWTWLSGKKTTIAAVLLVLAAFLQQVVVGQWELSAAWIPKAVATLEWFGMILGGVGLTHKGVKVIKGDG